MSTPAFLVPLARIATRTERIAVLSHGASVAIRRHAPRRRLRVRKLEYVGGSRNGGGGTDFGDRRGDDDFSEDGSLRTAFLSTLLARYSRSLVCWPYRTKALTTGVLMTVSDYLAQVLTQPMLEPTRLLRYLFYGLVVAGPWKHAWFSLLERSVSTRGLLGAVHKMALDQFVNAPLFIAAFVLFMHVAQGHALEGHIDMLREKHRAAFAASVRVWPLVNTLNFAVVPNEYRVVFAAVFNVFWVAFLSVSTSDVRQPTVRPRTHT